jgi:hypothetical protein
MAVTMEHLHEMLGRIERELAEARNAMAELTRTQKQDADAWWQARMQQVHARNRQLLKSDGWKAKNGDCKIQPAKNGLFSCICIDRFAA